MAGHDPGRLPPRAVLVTRPTDYETLVSRHGTHGQARFFLETRGQSIEVPHAAHVAFREARSPGAGGDPARVATRPGRP